MRNGGPAAALALAVALGGGCAPAAAGSVADADTLVIGVRSDLPLIGWQRPDGALEGFDVDVATYIADYLGAEPELVPILAEDRESVLLDGEADLVLALFSITQERKERVAFAGPYQLSYRDILVRPDDEDIDDVRDLDGRALCAVEGTNTAHRVVEELGVDADLVPAVDYTECLELLHDGEVDALTTNDVLLAGLAHTDGSGLRLVNARYSEERTGVGMRQGDVAGCEEINRAITAMYADGTARELLERWFGDTGIDLSVVSVPQFEGCS